GEPLLHQQGNDEYLVWAPGGGRPGLHSSPDRRMRERLEIRPRPGVRKDDLTQLRPVEMAVRREDGAAEPLHQPLERRLPGLDHLARHLIRVDDRDAERGEELHRGGLAARDAARQPDTKDFGVGHVSINARTAPDSPPPVHGRTSASASLRRRETARRRSGSRGSAPGRTAALYPPPPRRLRQSAPSVAASAIRAMRRAQPGA